MEYTTGNGEIWVEMQLGLGWIKKSEEGNTLQRGYIRLIRHGYFGQNSSPSGQHILHLWD